MRIAPPRLSSPRAAGAPLITHCTGISPAVNMFLLGFSLCLGIVHGIVPEISKTDMDIIANMETNVAQGQTTLSDMFKEVEELMEDTQQKLEDAVHQMDNETAKSNLHPQNVSSNLQNYSSIEIRAGNQSIYIAERINKTTDNSTEETNSSTTIQPRDKENSLDHECVIDEDCEKGRYCLYETHSSICLPCKQLDATCKKDEECCAGQLCVWGQCASNSTKGDAGTICQYQSDCKEEFCCAFHKALLFPVCSSKPIERERCIISANHLMELLSWDLQGEGPQEHCPCAGDLQCQHLGRGALCLKSQNSSEEDLTDTLYSEIDYIV
ncbi:dickkopf-related protein 3a [Ctenopharyngodon idella]|uniref:dickkopf-related protein 3a n=1 Tax=Ctenopharyngodon idella TaxID=7959 RepID=UPI002230D339|nr:dickkopf-related protein 3a [Ctenopharyngodon idella]XP_051755347.1 dickkopf-related protein 3a [Ctenopharyngodon idella]